MWVDLSTSGAPGGNIREPSGRAALRRRWQGLGRARYPAAHDLPLVADGGAATATGCARGKVELPRLANASGLQTPVNPFPPGSSQWNYIEHRLCG